MLRSSLNARVIPGLDAARAVAVTLVILFHFSLLPSSAGELGVMLFFVLSGFLITGILLREYATTGKISLREFYRRRAFRIFPTFYVCWCLELLLVRYHGVAVRWWEPWATFFYMTDYARAIAGPETIQFLPIAWSLAIEEKFYLLWPAALFWLLRSGRKPWRVVAAFIGGIWIYRAVLHAGLGVPYGHIYNAFDTRIDALMVGSLLAILSADAAADRQTARFVTSCIRSPWQVLGPLLSLLVLAGFDSQIKAHPWLSMTAFSAQPVLIAALLIQIVCFGPLYWRFLAHPALRFVARISYALYLYHALVLTEAHRITLSGFSGRLFGVRYLTPDKHPRIFLSVLPAILISVASYYCVELPFMRLRDRDRVRADSH